MGGGEDSEGVAVAMLRMNAAEVVVVELVVPAVVHGMVVDARIVRYEKKRSPAVRFNIIWEGSKRKKMRKLLSLGEPDGEPEQ